MKKEKKQALQNAVEGVKKIQNTLSGDAREFADAIVGALETLEADEEEHDLSEVMAEIERLRKDAEGAQAQASEDVANRMQKLRNELMAMVGAPDAKGHKLNRKVANEVARAILRSSGKESIENEVGKVLTKNGISGLQAADIVDYAIELKREDLNPIWNMLHKTMYNKFYYGAADLSQAAQIAHQWNKANAEETEKKIQSLSVNIKAVVTDYIYKRQQVAFKDLDDIEEAGNLADFLQFISQELYQMLIDTIVMVILMGDSVNAEGDKITTFEAIGTKEESDAFTSVVDLADEDLAAFLAAIGVDTATDLKNTMLGALRYTADMIWNPRAKRKVAIVNSKTLTQMAAYRYADGGDLIFRSRAEIAEQIGVDEIFTSDLVPYVADPTKVEAATPVAIFLLPDGYHVKEVKSIDVAYPTYEKNVRNFQKEINAGGAIHDLLSTSVLVIKPKGN